MKKQIRYGIFESNSSSTHSLTMCDEKIFDAWKRGELLYDPYGYCEQEFISANLSDEKKIEAAKYYDENHDDFQKDWKDLSEKVKEKYYMKYAKENNLIDEDYKTYDEFMDDDYLETFVDTYTTQGGETVVAFGKYGYN